MRDLWTEILGPALLRDEMGLLTEHCDQLEPHFVIQINSLRNYRWERCQDSLTRAVVPHLSIGPIGQLAPFFSAVRQF
jgi:hypothetical protein